MPRFSNVLRWGLVPCLWLLFANCKSPNQDSTTTQRPPNILFIAVDDLRPQLGCYGETYMQTPHLDRLAEQGRLFRRHYVQVPTCGASRFALLTGRYPQLRKHTNNQVMRDHLAEARQGGVKPLPELLRNQGYETVSLGKISHYVDGRIFTYEGEGDGRLEMPESWDVLWGPSGKWGNAWNAFFAYADGSNRNGRKKEGPPLEFVAERDEDLPDGLIAQRAVEELERLQRQDSPFFMAVGFIKPHLPFVAPKKYWDLYEGKEIPLSPNPELAETVPPMAVHRSSEMFNNYRDQPELGGAGVRLSDAYAMELRRAYCAAVSYSDAQVGKVLAALEATGQAENTLVVVWGDHGWHLGDHTIWGKHTLFERSLRSAMIIRQPGMQQAGMPTDALVETVDLYPTLLEWTGAKSAHELSGKSLMPLLADPTAEHKSAALGFWKSGLSLRNDRYRLTEWKAESGVVQELYDHQQDPNETQNLAENEAYEGLIETLQQDLHALAPATYWPSLKEK
ncbi:MAG: sulfatase [Bacteroidota bacterium]